MTQQQNALITGATGGIGAAISTTLAKQGFGLCLVGRRAPALTELASECSQYSARVEILCGDLADAEFLDTVVERAEAQLGPVDVLVNNAGMALRGSITDIDLGHWRQLQELNLNVAVALSQQVVPGMAARDGGAIINISSISGRNTHAGGAAYVASKHALNGFTGCLFEDVREHNIKVSSIMPGFVRTDMTAAMSLDAEKMLAPDDVAAAVSYVLSTSSTCCPTEIVLRPQRAP